MDINCTWLDVARVVVIGAGIYLISIFALAAPKPRFFEDWPRRTFFLTGVALLVFSTLDFYDDNVSRVAELFIWMAGCGILVLAGVTNSRSS